MVWLSEFSKKAGNRVDLGTVAPAEWDAIAAFGLMLCGQWGAWERSPAGIAITNKNSSFQEDFREPCLISASKTTSDLHSACGAMLRIDTWEDPNSAVTAAWRYVYEGIPIGTSV